MAIESEEHARIVVFCPSAAVASAPKAHSLLLVYVAVLVIFFGAFGGRPYFINGAGDIVQQSTS